jgi:hypothetical protein
MKLRGKSQERRDAGADALYRAGIPFESRAYGTTLLIREPGKPPIDLYPNTGRWRIVGEGAQTFEGGIAVFLEWYKTCNPRLLCRRQ